MAEGMITFQDRRRRELEAWARGERVDHNGLIIQPLGTGLLPGSRWNFERFANGRYDPAYLPKAKDG